MKTTLWRNTLQASSHSWISGCHKELTLETPPKNVKSASADRIINNNIIIKNTLFSFVCLRLCP